MIVIRTVCNTDWKGRPDHIVTVVAKVENKEAAIVAMNNDIRGWMIAEIVNYELMGIETEEGADEELDLDGKRAADLDVLTSEEIKALWMEYSDNDDGHWEMEYDPAEDNSLGRKFVEKDENDLSTTVYHFLNDL